MPISVGDTLEIFRPGDKIQNCGNGANYYICVGDTLEIFRPGDKILNCGNGGI